MGIEEGVAVPATAKRRYPGFGEFDLVCCCQLTGCEWGIIILEL